MARAAGGRVLLRLEDHDRQRCRPEYEAALLQDIEWLGFTPDQPACAELRQGPSSFRQSDNQAAYESALDVLRARYRVYACECSRRDEADRTDKADGTARSEEGETTGEVPYSGRCRDRGLAPGPGRGVRVAIEPGEETFTDLLLGEQRQDPSRQCGDLLLRDRLGNWTYQFAVVVDDLRHGVTTVIRGEDLLASTGRQIRLARMLGRGELPVFAHHPLILKPSGDKLSKANRDTAVRELRASGLTAPDVIGRAALAVGLIREFRAVRASDVSELFESGTGIPRFARNDSFPFSLLPSSFSRLFVYRVSMAFFSKATCPR